MGIITVGRWWRVYRVLLRLRKGEEVKYLSHRDVIRAFEFALRRAGVFVAYSTGFNPRPRMSFGSAIGVGVTSDDERIIVELTCPEPTSRIKEQLNSVMPTGMAILSAEEIPAEVKSPISTLNASEFRLTLGGNGCRPEAVKAVVDGLLSAAEVKVTRERRGRSSEVDIRPGILGVQISAGEENTVLVDVCLRITDTGGVRVQDFVKAIEEQTDGLVVESIRRIRQYHAEDT